ncbi:MAG: hypothetical protein OXC27_09550 [Caldilineaceae bacterium]|nr:hypothetical protein [Caldilineaceae bacterium]
MEPFTKPVDRQHDGQETAATHRGLPVPGWAVGVQGLTAYFKSSTPKRPLQRLDACTPVDEYFVL